MFDYRMAITRQSWNYIKLRTLKILCSPEVIIFGSFDTGISFKDSKLVYSKWFEMNLLQTYRVMFLCWHMNIIHIGEQTSKWQLFEYMVHLNWSILSHFLHLFASIIAHLVVFPRNHKIAWHLNNYLNVHSSTLSRWTARSVEPKCPWDLTVLSCPDEINNLRHNQSPSPPTAHCLVRNITSHSRLLSTNQSSFLTEW